MRYDSTDISGLAQLSTDSTLLEPRFEAVLSNEYFDFTAGFRLTRMKRGEGFNTDRGHIYSRFFLHKERLPETSIQFDRINIDEQVKNDSTETRLLMNSSYTIHDLSLYCNLEKKVHEVEGVFLKRDSLLNSASAQYRKSALNEKVDFSVGYLYSKTSMSTRSQVGVPFYEEIKPKRGLFAVDDTPFSGVLVDHPSLINGDTASSAGIEIGGAAHGGGINRNIGLEFDPPEDVDTFFLSVSQSLSPLSEEDFSWDIYSSNDNLNWVLVAASIPFSFDYTLNRFVITCPSFSARFIKLVNTGYNISEEQVSVTELQAFSTEVLIGRRKDDENIQNINFNLNITPSEKYSIMLSSYGSGTETRRGREFSEFNTRDNSINFFFRPLSFFSTTAGYILMERLRTPEPDEKDSSYFLSMNANFLEAIDVTLSGNNRSVKQDGRSDLDAESFLLRVAAQLYKDLNATLDLGYIDQKDYRNSFDSLSKSIRLTFYTKPRDEIILSGDYLRELIELTDITGIATERTQTNLSLDFTFRPSSLLNFNTRLLYQDLITIKGWSKIYRVDWMPFQGGMIQFNMSYEQHIRDVSGEQRDQATAGVRWNINKNAYLNLNYYFLNMKNGIERETKTASALLEINF